jgi:hypothetical protein
MNDLRKFLLASFILVLIFSAVGCESGEAVPTALSVDTRFQQFYDLQGGEQVLGPALVPMFNDGTRQMLLTENAQLIYDEQLPTGERYNFEKLGLLFGYQDPVLPIPEQPGIRYLNGHVVYAEFVPLFDQLGGVRFAGNPLTEVRLNTEKNRYEQYFEKLGFYRNLGDPENTVHLLPYGLIACQKKYPETGCQQGLQDAIINPQAYLPQPFVSTFERLGEAFTGKPLSQPYLAPDGRLEQIYENLVLSMDVNNLRTIGLRDLPVRVGISAELAVPMLNDPLMAFIQLDSASNLGHNVPKAFLEYIAAHGGNDLSGLPISELNDVNGLRRQCFTNYCLDFDSQAPAGANIHPVPLGYEYQRLQGYLPAEFNLRTWEARPILAPGEAQIVGVMVYNATPSQPVANLQPTLEVSLPNGSRQKLVFPPTGAGGTAYLTVTLAEAKAGETIVYEVCAAQPGSVPTCSKEAWLVK